MGNRLSFDKRAVIPIMAMPQDVETKGPCDPLWCIPCVYWKETHSQKDIANGMCHCKRYAVNRKLLPRVCDGRVLDREKLSIDKIKIDADDLYRLLDVLNEHPAYMEALKREMGGGGIDNPLTRIQKIYNIAAMSHNRMLEIMFGKGAERKSKSERKEIASTA